MSCRGNGADDELASLRIALVLVSMELAKIGEETGTKVDVSDPFAGVIRVRDAVLRMRDEEQEVMRKADELSYAVEVLMERCGLSYDKELLAESPVLCVRQALREEGDA